jgi:antitoxin component YwqK of YwqJK toxin-antitoxin module
MKHLLLALLTILFASPAMAGEDWKTYFKNSEVEVQYLYSDCHDDANGIHQQKVLLKFINLQNKKVEVFFTKELSFSNNTTGTPDVREFSVQLNANETLQGQCDTKNNRLFIFSKQLNFSSTQLTHFELKNITVKPIQ